MQSYRTTVYCGRGGEWFYTGSGDVTSRGHITCRGQENSTDDVLEQAEADYPLRRGSTSPSAQTRQYAEVCRHRFRAVLSI